MDARLIIDRHIQEALGREMAFPSDYCATFAAAVVRDVHGVDVLGNRFAGDFAATEADAYRDFPLGLAVTAARRMRELRWVKCCPVNCRAGDFAVVRVPGYGHGIAVALGNGWFVRRVGAGVRFETADLVVAAWRPPEER